MKNRFLRVRLSVLSLAVFLALPSLAQVRVSSSLAATVVNATRFTEPPDSLPMGVSVITADQIRASGASTVNEAIASLVGVPSRQDLYGGGDYALDLRGFGATSDSNQVLVLDGVRLNEADTGGTRLAGIPIESVERIEILRGSGSVLYGEGATGGVIVITTKAGNGSDRRNSASLYGAVGSYDLREVRSNATLVSGGFSIDLNAQRRDTSNHRPNFRSTTDGTGIVAQWSGANLRLGVRFGEDSLDTGLPGPLSATQFASDPGQTKPSELNNRASIRNKRSGVFGEFAIGDWLLGGDIGWREKSLESAYPTSLYGYEIKARQLAWRARHATPVGDARNTFVFGFDRAAWDREVSGSSSFGPFGSFAEQTSDGFYAKDDIVFATGTRISVGGRTEKVDKRLDNGFSVLNLNDKKRAWDAGLSQSLNAQTTIWGRLGSSYRLANVDEFSFTTPVPIRPQMSRDLESGVRWASDMVKFEFRGYENELTDEIGYDPNALGISNGANINYSPTLRRGLELEGSMALSSFLSLSARLALRRSTFRDGAYSGNDIPLAPRRMLTLRADWVPFAMHKVSGGLNFVGAQYPDFANNCQMPSYTTADVRYAFQVKGAELSLRVNNLFDRDYYTLAIACAGGKATSVYPEAGRTFTAAVRWLF